VHAVDHAVAPAEVGGSGLVRADQTHFLVNRDAYRNPAVFEKEMGAIFGRCWLYLGHDSEIPKPGDFVTRRIARREILFTRDRKGEPRAFFNSCTHRGVAVCREKSGNRKNYTCPYHGWVYSSEGKLLDYGMAGGYGPEHNARGQYNLKRPARLDQYRGFFFINFNSNAVSLADYLADSREIIDLVVDQTEGSQEIIGGMHEYVIKANYKYLAENSYDGYHGVPTHETYFRFLERRLQEGGGDVEGLHRLIKDYPSGGRAWGLGNGHGVFEALVPNGRPVAYWMPDWGPEAKVEIDAIRARLLAKFGAERGRRITDLHRNMVIFPNLVINDHVAVTVRAFQPEAVNRMRVTAWAMGPKDESPLLRKFRLDNFLTFLGPAGFATPDDNEMLELAQIGCEGAPIEFSDLSRGRSEDKNADMMRASGPWTNEQQMRAYWTQWDRIMSGAETLESD
jgi:p-cumate 2,3-dioxygenase alpha subunit